ncbi:hypothetical protein IU501_17430 [Nocardia otitidiscaviarum]|uniref:hypothetical protein n=1 Tax=Nocardia otitidiscaviarum TaxID=1823 RepID=UPI000A8ABFED|nr:hypothetical protein [Nocardia otitidiscaviarum]MBF6134779.1 hypothetical protein [Nocardia otitidiscaviarum]MBF6485595.1 hypothetical protein [Nocardia otitidiscaviarum]
MEYVSPSALALAGCDYDGTMNHLEAAEACALHRACHPDECRTLRAAQHILATPIEPR